jgi:hypothetical protein
MLLTRLASAVAVSFVIGSPAVLMAQGARVNGTVVNERLEPIRGATLRLTGADSSLTTGPSGTFQFEGIFPSGMILTVSAPGYEFRSIPLSPGNTTLTITMKSSITTLDKMVIRPKGVRVKGQVVDDRTGEALLFARVSLFPDGRTVDASNVGDFRFDSIQGPVTIVAEAMEHLPVQIQLNPSRDTTIKLRMRIDSVAVRMIAQQVTRLQKRSQAVPHTLKYADSERIQNEARTSIAEMVDKLLIRPMNRRTLTGQSANDACVFYDDKKIPPGMLLGIYPELVERVEVYARGAMIRVYSKRYVMALTAQGELRKVLYLNAGMRPVCE